MNIFNRIFFFLLYFLIGFIASFYILDNEGLHTRNLTIESMANIREDFYMVNYQNDYYFEDLINQGSQDLVELFTFIESKFGNYYNFTDQLPKMEFSCSAFNVLNKEEQNLFGRNFDYRHSPSFIVWTQPKNGYKSVSFVLGLFIEIESNEDIVKDKLLLMPYAPLDGLNEYGLGISVLVAQQKYGNHQYNHSKLNITTSIAIRGVLDTCKTTKEAIELFNRYNMHDINSDTSYHFFITDNSGQSAVIEYVDNEMKVFKNHEFNFSDYVYVTNFYLNKKVEAGNNRGLDRYKKLEAKLKNDELRMDWKESMELLKNVSQGSTVWSNVYNTEDLSLMTAYNHSYYEIYKFNVLEPMKYDKITDLI